MTIDRFPRLTLVFGALFGLTSASCAVTLPKEGIVDYTSCHVGKELVSVGPDANRRAFLREFTVQNRSNPPGGFVDMTTSHCISMVNNLDPKATGLMTVCATKDSDGDVIYTSFTGDGKGNSQAGYVVGTGKYEGMERTAKSTLIGDFPAMKPGDYSRCQHFKGTYKLK